MAHNDVNINWENILLIFVADNYNVTYLFKSTFNFYFKGLQYLQMQYYTINASQLLPIFIKGMIAARPPHHTEATDGSNTTRQHPAMIPIIYALTPTYTRPQQKAELTRVSQTFLHLTSFHWIVIEDSQNKTSLVANFLANCSIEHYTHLNIKSSTSKNIRGLESRNLALDWLLNNTDSDDKGVVYFADDDNTYDLKIFDEVRV